jgi:micrococcal nuclease
MRRSIVIVLLLFVLPLFLAGETASVEKRMYRIFLQVEDGDTVIYRGIHMRFLGVDTPEIAHPGVGIYRDQPYGQRAKQFTRTELRKARRVTYRADGHDRYDRLLVHIFVDGYPLSLKLVEVGLAYETVTVFGDNGFPEISERILQASLLHPDLPFQNPYQWRKINRHIQ